MMCYCGKPLPNGRGSVMESRAEGRGPRMEPKFAVEDLDYRRSAREGEREKPGMQGLRVASRRVPVRQGVGNHQQNQGSQNRQEQPPAGGCRDGQENGRNAQASDQPAELLGSGHALQSYTAASAQANAQIGSSKM
jgi:hypothetical protein